MYCARHALGIGTQESCEDDSCVASAGDPRVADATANGHAVPGKETGNHAGAAWAVAEDGGDEADGGADAHADEEAFLLVLGDHLYRRGAGTTRPCASQLIHAYLEHGDAGKPAIGLKVRLKRLKEGFFLPENLRVSVCSSWMSLQRVLCGCKRSTRKMHVEVRRCPPP